MKNRLFILGILLCCLQTAWAGVPQQINHQGYLTDATGSPIDGTQNITFSLYDVSSDGTALWTSGSIAIEVNNGFFSHNLGSVTSLSSVEFTDPLYLGIQIESDPEMTPRQLLTSVPFAKKAESAEAVSDSTITSASIVDGTIVDADISNVSSDKVTGLSSVATSGSYNDLSNQPTIPSDEVGTLTADKWCNTDGSTVNCSEDAPIKPAQVVWVATSGGDYTSIQSALDSITDASASKSYVIKVAPGTYTEQVTMKEYVDIEGSGEGTTIISYTGGGDYTDATVTGADNTELRFLTVESNGNYIATAAILNANASPRITHITMIASGGSGHNFGMYNLSSSPIMTNTTVTASGGTNNYGMYNYDSSSPTIRNSNLTGTTNSIYNDGSTAIVANTILDGDVNSTGFTCSNVSNASGDLLDTSCNSGTANQVLQSDGSGNVTWEDVLSPAQVVWVATSGGDYTSIQTALDNITDASASKPYVIKVAPGTYTEQVTMKEYVDIEGSGEETTTISYTGGSFATSFTITGANNAELRFLSVESDGSGGSTYAIGIYNEGTSPTMTHITASASGGTHNIGIYNNTVSSPTMTNITAIASGGINSYGIFNDNVSSPTMTHITATASGGTSNNHGISNWFDASPTIYNSKVSGTTNSIYNNSSTAKVAHTMLDGGSVTGGGFTCIGAYNETFTALDTTCQ